MRRTLALAALAASATAAVLVPTLSASAAPASSCAKWAATNGDDGNPGTAASPYRSLAALVANLQAGQTGCLPSGQAYQAIQGNGIFTSSHGTTDKPVTITSGGEGRAQVVGWVEARANVHDVVLTDLDFLGSPTNADGSVQYPKSTHINLLGDRITLKGNDITNPYGICVNAGAISAYQSVDPGEPSEDVVITDNRVHGCGMSPKLTWTDGDSGAHGIYLVNTRRAVVTQNLVYDNRYRGFQQWPTGSGTVVANNLFARNATQVNVGSALTDGYPWYSSDTTVRDNVMVAKTDYRTDKNQASVAFNFPAGSPSYGNTVMGNCISADRQQLAGFGYTASGTVSATATFIDAAHDDFRMTSDSPCQGKGPASIQPTAVTPAPTATAPAPAPVRKVTTSTASCAARTVTSRAPSAATSTPSADFLWFRAELYVWNGAWTRVKISDWHYSRVDGSAMTPWTRYTDRVRTSSVTFTGLTAGAAYRIVQDVEWDLDGVVARTNQTMTGSTSTVYCRV